MKAQGNGLMARLPTWLLPWSKPWSKPRLGSVDEPSQAVRSRQLLLMQHAVTKVLADAPSLSQAIPAILHLMGESQAWVAAGCWRLTADGRQLRNVDVWSLDEAALHTFSALQRDHQVTYDTTRNGMLVRAWREQKPAWILDVTQEAGYRRREAALAAGLRGAFVLPVVANGEVLRLMEFYSRDARQPDPMLIDLAQSLGNQIGQFILRRNAEAALHQAHDRVEMAVRASGIGFWDTDIKSGNSHVSEQFAHLLGYSLADFPRGRRSVIAMIHPQDRAQFFSTYASGIESGNTFTMDFRLRLRDGGYHWFAGRAKVTYDSSRQPTRVAGSLADIEKRKQLDLAKDEFVATISHELKTPLTAIRGSLGLLDGGVAGELSADAKALVGVALSGAERLTRLVNDILSLTKIESADAARLLPAVDLDALVARAVKANRPCCDEFGVDLQADLNAAGTLVQVNADQLMQVLTNLISNAAKFSARGAEVRAITTRSAHTARISIVDSGRGIPVDFRNRIFQKFEQADSSDSRLQQGSGLGLAISRALVTRMGGVIDYTDRGGGGTVFFVDLPVQALNQPVNALA